MMTDFEPLALISGPSNVGDNWRIIHPYRRMRQAGINARWFGLDTQDDALIQTDPERTVLVVRLLTGPDEASIDQWIAERRPKVRAIVYEMDDVAWGDAMVDHLESSNFMQGRPRAEVIRQGEMAKYLASRCDGVITASEPLAELVRRDIPGQTVVTCPNAIDTRWFRAQMAHRAPWQRDGRVTIGWLGGHRPEADVAPMAEAWGRIARRYPHVRFVVAAPVVPDVFYRCVDDIDRIIRYGWTPWEDCPVLFQTDVGCAAISDTVFSRCKTWIKALEYGTAGAAVVATPLLYGEIIEHERNGLLATTADEWEAALSRLVEDERLRRRLVIANRSRIERLYSLDVCLPNWIRAYETIVAAKERVAA
jgi:glycosyltransferase involved in cell wall biosynthesis